MMNRIEIGDPWSLADKLWEATLGREGITEKRLMVDPETLYKMQHNRDQWMTNVQMIGRDGEPVMEYRDGWEIIRVVHYDIPEVGTIAEVEVEVEVYGEKTRLTPHMAFAFRKPNGRHAYLDWEGNNEKLT